MGISKVNRALWNQVESGDNLLDKYVAVAKSGAFLKEYYKFHNKPRPQYPIPSFPLPSFFDYCVRNLTAFS